MQNKSNTAGECIGERILTWVDWQVASYVAKCMTIQNLVRQQFIGIHIRRLEIRRCVEETHSCRGGLVDERGKATRVRQHSYRARKSYQVKNHIIRVRIKCRYHDIRLFERRESKRGE